MKRFLSITLVFLLLAVVLTSSVYSLETEDTEIRIRYQYRIVDCTEIGQSAIIRDGVTYIPLRAMTNHLGIDVNFEESEKTATFDLNGDVFTFKAGQSTYFKNNKETVSKEAIIISNNQIMLPLEVFCDTFDLSAEYNSEFAILDVKDGREKNSSASSSDSKNSSEFLTVVSAMSEGFLVTLKLFAITLLGALPLGLIISLCSMSKFLPLKWLTRFLVWIIRGTPLMLQLLIIFFIPGMVMEGGSPWPRGEDGRFMAASVAFIINYAFYFSEIFRGGIESIPQGQVEAGQVLGMTKTQIFFNVTLLQMVKRIVPPMANEIITLVKDTSIARIISLQEVIWAGYAFLKGSHGYSGLLWPLFFTGVYYLAFNGILTLLFGYIEKKLSYFKS